MTAAGARLLLGVGLGLVWIYLALQPDELGSPIGIVMSDHHNRMETTRP